MKFNFVLSGILVGALLGSGVAVASGAVKAGSVSAPRLVAEGTAISETPSLYKYVFSNGLRVLILPDFRNPVATVRVRLDAGSNREVLGKTGLAHFFEHMMFRKTRFSEEGHYDKVLASVGGSGNAATSTDYVVFHSLFPAPALETVMELEAQRMLGVDLQEPYFSTEKGAVISERGLRYDNVPAMRGHEVLTALTERGTPYEWLTIGEKKDVAGMKIADVQKFFADYYTPDNAVISVGGAVEKEQALALVQKYFGAWKGRVASGHSQFSSDYLARHAGKSFVCSEDVAQKDYSLVYPSLSHRPEDAWFAMMFSEALDDHSEGTLERRLVKARLATGFGASRMSWRAENQHFVASFDLSADQDIGAARAAWETAVSDVLKKPVDKRFRQRIVKQLVKLEADNAEKMSSLLSVYEENEARFANPFIDKKMIEFVNKVPQSDYREWVRANVLRIKPYLTGVVPAGQAKPCAEMGGMAQ
jgi:hypothetical protein